MSANKSPRSHEALPFEYAADHRELHAEITLYPHHLRPSSQTVEATKRKDTEDARDIAHVQKQKKDTVVSLEHVCAHSVCNDVWWRPYPTNLPPPFQIANETHVVSPAVLENWVDVTAGQSQPGFHRSTSETGRSMRCLFASK